MRIYVLEHSYYIGDNPPQYVLDNAQIKDVEIPNGKQIKIVNWEVTFVDEGDLNEI